MVEKLEADARDKGLQDLNGWVYDESTQAIGHVFKFKNFSEAFGFISRVALAAQQADHHPDWSNSYDTVTITLSTHDAGGVTDKDLALAEAIDKLLT